MQLTDAEIREILIRRKIEKKRRLRRRRRRSLIILLLIIIITAVIVKVVSSRGGGLLSGKDGSSSGAAAPGDSRGIIFLDPGHGGSDPGSDDNNGRNEKDDTLRLGLAVRDYIEDAGFTVIMSRTEDVDVDRAERGRMANESGAALFVSIHRNQADTGGHGVEGFIPSRDDADSRLLGENIMHALGRVGFAERTIRAGTLNDPSDDYEEVAANEMPSVLIEVGFLSSDVDNRLFDVNLQKNAKAIAGAVDYTFMKLHEPEKAAEYEEREKAAEQAAKKAVKAVKKAAKNTAKIIAARAESESPEDSEPEGGIDPEA